MNQSNLALRPLVSLIQSTFNDSDYTQPNSALLPRFLFTLKQGWENLLLFGPNLLTKVFKFLPMCLILAKYALSHMS